MTAILLVNDRYNNGALAGPLEERGITADNAPFGPDTVPRAAAGVYDVVVFNVIVPEDIMVDAVGMIKKIRPDMEVIFFTEHASIETAIRCLEGGAFDYVLKPDVDDLAEKIRQALEKKGLYTEAMRE